VEFLGLIIISAPPLALGAFICVKAHSPRAAVVLLPVGLLLIPVAVWVFTIGILVWPVAMILVGMGSVALVRRWLVPVSTPGSR